jgi:hypothetical protein
VDADLKARRRAIGLMVRDEIGLLRPSRRAPAGAATSGIYGASLLGQRGLARYVQVCDVPGWPLAAWNR